MSPLQSPHPERRPAEHAREVARAALGDKLLVGGVVVWILALVPSFVPILGPELTFSYADQYSEVPGLLVVAAGIVLAWRSTLLSRERAFWIRMGVFVGLLLAVSASYAVLPDSAWSGSAVDLVHDSAYVLSYLVLIIALARAPDRARMRGARGRLLYIELVGTWAFVFGLLAYFIILPSVFAPEVYSSWVPSLLMYAVLDAYLVVRLASLTRTSRAPQWRRFYAWLGLAFGTWLVADLVEGLLYLEAIPWIDSGTPFDLLWHVPALFLILAVQSRRWPVHSVQPADATPRAEDRLEGILPRRTALAALALALPAVHFALGITNVREPGLDTAREILLLIFVGLSGALLLWHQHVMRRLTQSIDADRQQISDQLQIAQRMEAVGRLASGVAHDFSNILSVIRGRAELLVMTGNLGHENLDDTREIVEASRRGQSLVSHLLTLGRRRPSGSEVIDLASVVDDLSGLFERLLPDSIELRTSQGEGGPPLVCADRARLEQVILNLVVNARDAMPDGGTLEIRTEHAEIDDHDAAVHGGGRGGEYVVLRVTDTGPGVPPDIRPLVFEPFFTTKEEASGTGLGLSIVYSVARQAQGFVRIADALGGGAVFEVYFPHAEREAGVVEPQPERRGPSKGRETILLVEDYEALRKTAARVLRESGYKVLESGSAAEALSMLERRNERIELLVADLVLPDMSGFELETRAREQAPELATVFISGYPEGVTPLRIPEDATVIEKPFSPDVLTFIVRRTLDERQRFLG